MRKLYWFLTIYAKKHGLLFFATILITIIIFSFFVPYLAKKITVKRKEYIGMVGDYNLYSLPTSIKAKLSVGLTAINENKTISPVLTERWSVEDDGKSYRFIVKKNVKWQDGKDLTPQDISYNLEDTEIITTPNDIIFKLPDHFSPFPAVVSEPIFRYGEQKYFLFFKRPTLIGIGTNKILSYQRSGNKLKELVIETPEKRLIYRFYLTENEAIIAFKKGEVDVIEDITDPRDLGEWPNVQVEKTLDTSKYLAVFFDNSLPVLSKNVRQALAYSLEKKDDESRALGPIDKKSWAYLEGGKSYKKDIDRAIERLLDEIPPEPIKLELTTTSLYQKNADSYKQQWQELGDKAYEICLNKDEIKDKELCQNVKIEIKIKITNFPDTNNFQLLLIGQESPPDPDQYFLWHSSQATNFTKYKNTRIDSLLEKGRQTLDEKDRLAIYQEYQQFLLEDPPAIFLEYLNSYTLRRK